MVDYSSDSGPESIPDLSQRTRIPVDVNKRRRDMYPDEKGEVEIWHPTYNRKGKDRRVRARKSRKLRTADEEEDEDGEEEEMEEEEEVEEEEVEEEVEEEEEEMEEVPAVAPRRSARLRESSQRGLGSLFNELFITT